MIIQPIINIAEICFQKGVRHVVLSPGSRCAHLVVAFVRHPGIQTYTISDERTAAFVALGMAQQLQETVALVCTSGTAALNYYPAIAEAFYQKIPLLVFTADRPDEWIDQLDGQTIRQKNVYHNHILKSYHLPVDYSHKDAKWYLERSVNEAINITQKPYQQGPVHINVPIREPFYPEPHEEVNYEKVRIYESIIAEKKLTETMVSKLNQLIAHSSKILIVIGQQRFDQKLIHLIEQYSTTYNIPVIADVIANCPVSNRIKHVDITLFDSTLHDSLQPDCVISFGKSVLSKSVKSWLRKCTVHTHIHIQEGNEIADYSQSISHLIETDVFDFFAQIRPLNPQNSSYLNLWKNTDKDFKTKLETHFTKCEFSEFEAIKIILDTLPENCNLHLANSMAVRYVNYLGVPEGVEVFANRGTSGIDGSTSTAVGVSICSNKKNILISGDMAFLYDRNAFWHNQIPNNLFIFVLNNNGGGIFRIIEGPNKLPELNTYFETKQNSNMSMLAEEFGLYYYTVNEKKLLSELCCLQIYKNEKVLCEIKTDSVLNTTVLKQFTQNFKK